MSCSRATWSSLLTPSGRDSPTPGFTLVVGSSSTPRTNRPGSGSAISIPITTDRAGLAVRDSRNETDPRQRDPRGTRAGPAETPPGTGRGKREGRRDNRGAPLALPRLSAISYRLVHRATRTDEEM